jgi:antitoxin CptB
MSDPASSERARLRWRCRRGMRELDILMCGYLEQSYDGASEADRAAFRALLELPDPELLYYFTGRQAPDDPELRRLVDLIASRRRTDAPT